MGSYDHGFAGMASLRAINQWIGVINSNLGGANRTAYKATKVSFSGLVSRIDRDPRSTINGIQFPDSSLSIGSTRVDFSQGTIVQDGELTHLAISGDGFYAVSTGAGLPGSVPTDNLNYATSNAAFAPIIAPFPLTTPETIFFTRDGEFRWTDIDGLGTIILTTASGLTVLGCDGGVIGRIGNGTTFSSTITTITGADRCVGVFRFVNNQSLKFSKFGSTVFDATQGGAISLITDVEIIQSALESSNSALSDTLPELSLAQKMFSAISKIITINNEDLDVVINLIR